jgi:NADH dehydrogenase
MLLGKNVTVFGGTGFVGNSVVNELSKAGYNTKVVVRRPERYREILMFPNAKIAQLDNFDNAEQLQAAIQGSDIVINLTVDRSTGFEMIEQDALAETARKIKSAVEKAGVKRVLSLSQIGANNDEPNSEWFGVLGEVDNMMHNVAKAESTIFKASLLIGEGDQTTQKYINQLKRVDNWPVKFDVLPVAKSKTVVQPLWIKDFSVAMVAAIGNKDVFGKKLEIAGEERLTIKELALLITEIMQRNTIVFGMCDLNAKIMAALNHFAPIASVDKSQLFMLTKNLITDDDFSSQFGFVPNSLEKTIAPYAVPGHVRQRLNYFRKEAGRNSNELV